MQVSLYYIHLVLMLEPLLFTIYIGGINAIFLILYTLGIDVVTVAIYYIYIGCINAIFLYYIHLVLML